jgi:hypothetical protein
MDELSRQRQFEDQFLSQLRTRAAALTRGILPADRVVFEPTPDGVDALHATLNRLEVYDRDTLEKLPGRKTLQLRFQRGLLGGLFRRTIKRLRVQVLAPVAPLLQGERPAPVDGEQVKEALARYEVMPRKMRPSAVVLASASGFTHDAQALASSAGPPSLILMGGREDGGWNVQMPTVLRRSPWGRLFELETQDERLKRLMYHLEQNASLVDSRGISIPDLSEKLGLPAAQTEAVVRRACRAHSRLLTVVHEGTIHVCRTPLGAEGDAMSIWSRIRRLLRLKPSVAERVRAMTAQRVKLEQQRHELDQKTETLEAEEREAIKQGAAAPSDAERKQLAGKLMRTRRELRRHRAQAQMFTRQIDIIGTHVHHLTLAEQGKRMELPKAEELTREAAQAEQVMSELAVNADLAASIEVTGETPMMAEEEAAIFEEFKQAAAAEAPTTETSAREPAAPAAGESRAAADTATPPPPPARKKGESARPELG